MLHDGGDSPPNALGGGLRNAHRLQLLQRKPRKIQLLIVLLPLHRSLLIMRTLLELLTQIRHRLAFSLLCGLGEERIDLGERGSPALLEMSIDRWGNITLLLS